MSERYHGDGDPRLGWATPANERNTEHLYTARSAGEPLGSDSEGYENWGADDPQPAYYTPNEPGAAAHDARDAYGPRYQEESQEYAVADEFYDDSGNDEPQGQPDWTSQPAAYYRRPGSQPDAGGEREEMTFAPPPKFEAERFDWHSMEEGGAAAPLQRNVYQPRKATWAATVRTSRLSLQDDQYRVEATRDVSRVKKRRKKSAGKRLIVLLALAVLLAAGAYLAKDWLLQQVSLLTGAEQVSASQAGPQAQPVTQAKGFDAAPETKLNAKAQRGIAAISGTMNMETMAVTLSNVAARTAARNGMFDYYLFAAADGKLLGYYEGLAEDGFIVQPGDSFYVRQEPYLLDNQGKALIKAAMYEQAAGRDAVLGPLENGWAVIQDAAGAKYNYINAEGKLLSALWFCRAFPFYGQSTLAYVDTGNMAKPEERYALYRLDMDGTMELWQHAAGTTGVVDAACNLALLDTGELLRISDLASLGTAAQAVAYLDCDAVVAQDQQTGLWGLFVDGEQHYDFAYQQIGPVQCEIQWKEGGSAPFAKYAVAGAKYPQPLSHYFLLQKDAGQEYVALSTRSCCPVLMD